MGNKVQVETRIALDGLAMQIQDGPEAFHTMQAFIGLVRDEASGDVQRGVVELLALAMDPGDE